MLIRNTIISFVLAICSILSVQAQIVVDNSLTPEENVFNHLLGTGVTISNISFNGGVTTPDVQIANFVDPTGSIGFESGIILSNGNTSSIEGPNDATLTTTGISNNTSYDLDLLALALPFYADPDDAAIHHSTYLEFDFFSEGSLVKFNFVFASDEYLEAVGTSYNDVFGFFVSGPGFAGPYTNGAENLAIVPGTTNTPISVNNINPSSPHSAYYISGSSGDPNTQADGYTTAITIEFEVECNEPYHFKFALADVQDSSIDSWVLIEEKSFTSQAPTEVSTNATNTEMTEGCNSVTLEFNGEPGTSVDIDMTGTTATPGVDYEVVINGQTFDDFPDPLVFPPGVDNLSITVNPLIDADSPLGAEFISLVLDNNGATTACNQVLQDSIVLSIFDNNIGASLLSDMDSVLCLGVGGHVLVEPNAAMANSPWEFTYDLIDPDGQVQTITQNPTNTLTQSVAYTPTAPGVYTFELVSVKQNGCSGIVNAQNTGTLTILEIPTVELTGGGEFCDGDSLTALFEITGTGPQTLSYDRGGGEIFQPILATESEFSFDVINTETVEALSIISDIGGCEGTIVGSPIQTFTELSPITLDTPDSVSICPGIDFEIPFTIVGDYGPFDIEYRINNLPQPVLQNYNNGDILSGATPGIYTFTKITSTTGPLLCSNPVSVSTVVENHTTPSASIQTENVNLCANTSHNIAVNFTGTAPFTFDYSMDGTETGTPIVTNTTPYNLTVDQTGVYKLHSASDNHCPGTISNDSVSIVVATLITNDADTVLSTCYGNAITLNSNAGGGVNEPFDYEWTLVSDPLNILSTSDSYIANPLDGDSTIIHEAQYQLQISQPLCGDVQTFIYYVTVNPNPEAVFSDVDATICPGSTYGLEVNTTSTQGNVSFTYTYASTSETIVTGVNPYIITLDDTQLGVYNLNSITDTDNMCVTMLNSAFELFDFPEPKGHVLDADTTICSGDSIVMNVIFDNPGNHTFEHRINNVITGDLIVTGGQNPFPLTIGAEGVHTIGVITDDNCSSFGEGACEITYYDDVVAGLVPDVVVCEGDPIELVAAGVNGGHAPSYTYNWSLNGITLSTDSIFNYAPDSTNTITLSAEDFCASPDSTEVIVTVENYPEINFVADVTSVCPDEFVTFTDSSIVNTVGNTYDWNFGDVTTGMGDQVFHAYQIPGNFDVVLTVTTPAGCSSSDSIKDFIAVNPNPTANFIFDPIIGNMSDPEINFENLSTGHIAAHWNFGDFTESTVNDPTHVFPEDIAYDYDVCLDVVNEFGCEADICKTVRIQPIYYLFTPNAFTPDGDGVNDQFAPSLHTSTIAEYDFSVFDRDGNIVFQSNDPNKKWDGTHMGRTDYLTVDGIYNWTLRVRLDSYSDIYRDSGSVTVLR